MEAEVAMEGSLEKSTNLPTTTESLTIRARLRLLPTLLMLRVLALGFAKIAKEPLVPRKDVRRENQNKCKHLLMDKSLELTT